MSHSDLRVKRVVGWWWWWWWWRRLKEEEEEVDDTDSVYWQRGRLEAKQEQTILGPIRGFSPTWIPYFTMMIMMMVIMMVLMLIIMMMAIMGRDKEVISQIETKLYFDDDGDHLEPWSRKRAFKSVGESDSKRPALCAKRNIDQFPAQGIFLLMWWACWHFYGEPHICAMNLGARNGS